MVITSGSLPPNPAELLGSQRMSQILDELRGQVDIVVIDTPPSLVADAQILAGKVDAVLFVLQPGVTHAETARAAFALFQRTGARVIGTVLNRIPRSRSYYYGGYKYYSQYGKGKGYYAANTAEAEKKLEHASAPPTIESSSPYSLLNQLTKLPPQPEELPPPDPPRA